MVQLKSNVSQELILLLKICKENFKLFGTDKPVAFSLQVQRFFEAISGTGLLKIFYVAFHETILYVMVSKIS